MNDTSHPQDVTAQEVTACVLVIGNEVLSGRTQDANINHFARELTALGIRLMECRVLPDIEDEIVDALNHCRAKYDYVFTTGGIGSTHDDITAKSVAKAFGVEFGMHPEAERILLDHYGDRANDARMRMAQMPLAAELVDNPISRAPGFRLDNVFVMAGVPAIARAMLDGVKATLKGGRVQISKTVSTTDLSEGQLADALAGVQLDFPDVDIGSYPFLKLGGFGVNLVARGTEPAQVDAAYDALVRMITELGGTPIESETQGEALPGDN